MSDVSVRERIKERHRDGVEPERFLIDVGAVEERDGSQLGFTSALADLIAEHVGAIGEGAVTEADVAELYDLDVTHVEDQQRSYPAYQVIHTVEKWPSEAALTFDIGTHRALHELSPRWEDVPATQRPRIIEALRAFQDGCIFCKGSIVYGEEPVESCCSEVEVLTLHCEDCDRRFLEFRTDDKPSRGQPHR